jgi:DNA-binding XRE family transcriptional regulator
MSGMGLYTRRLRELCGLSQEQLARLAGVSQGAVSRLEMGRAVHSPLIVVMKVNAAMRRALSALDPKLLSPETRRLMDVPARGVPHDAARFEELPLTPDPLLTDLVGLFWQVPSRNRQKLVELMRAAAGVLGAEADAPGSRRGRRRGASGPVGS